MGQDDPVSRELLEMFRPLFKLIALFLVGLLVAALLGIDVMPVVRWVIWLVGKVIEPLLDPA